MNKIPLTKTIIRGNFFENQSQTDWNYVDNYCNQILEKYFNLNDILDVTASLRFLVIRTLTGLYSLTKDGNLDKIPLPVFLTPTYNIQKIRCGMYHILLLMSNGDIITFRYSTNGKIDGTSENMRLITGFNGKKAKDIACGDFFNLVLVEDGSIFRSGDNNGRVTSLEFKQLLSFENYRGNIIKLIACGVTSVFLTDEGRVYAQRYSVESLGRVHAQRYSVESLGETSCVKFIKQPTTLYFTKHFVKNIWCSMEATFIQTIEDEVYVCGDSESKSLFKKTPSDRTDRYELSPFLSGKKIKEMYGFYNGMFALSESGEVYACGLNYYKQIVDSDQRTIDHEQHAEFTELFKKYNQDEYDYTFTCTAVLTCIHFIKKPQDGLLLKYIRNTEKEKNFFMDVSFVNF